MCLHKKKTSCDRKRGRGPGPGAGIKAVLRDSARHASVSNNTTMTYRIMDRRSLEELFLRN